ncbi:MAG: leucine-rich repeat protein, partial [Clostridia bacterium]|nr:leucine-rich repeat protein [Clostridia bacterium]
IYAHWGKSEIQHTLTITAPKGATITINGEQTVTNGKLEIFRGYLDGYNITINAEDGYVLTSYRDEGWNIIECETVEQMQSVSLSVAATGDANIECWVVEAATVTVDGLTDTSFVIPVDKNVYNYIRDNYKKILNIFSSESEHSIDEYTCGLYLDEGLQTPLGENITGEQFKAMGIKTLYTKQVTLYYDNNAEMLLEITINDNKNPTYAIAVIKSRIDGVNVVVPKSYKTKINGTDYTLPVQQVTFSNAYSALRTKISSIIIPSTVTSISFTYEQDGNNDVYNSLTSIIVVGDNPIYDSRDNCNAIIETATNTLIRGSNFTVIPDTVTTLGEYCFAGADISKPSKEGQWAGDGHGYTIPYSVSFIDLGAYMNVITSGGGGFYEYIDETQWTYASSNSSTTWTELQSSQSLFIISANNYLRKKNTTTLSATFELNADGQSYTLVECKDTTSTHIIVPAIYNGKPVTKIGSYAFNGNTTVQTVTLPLTIQEIGDSAFEGCTNLTNINLPNGLTTIGRAAFKWAGLSGELKIPASVVSIGAHAFSQVVVGYDEKGLESSWELYKDSNSNVVGKITSLIFEENAKCEFIGQRAFGWCASITNIALPSSLKHIEVGAFHCCTGLKTFSFGENSKLEYIAKNAFNSCRYIDDEGELQPTAGLDISNLQNLKYIGEKAFQNTYITSFTIPQNVEHIDIDAFRTTKLTNLSVNSNSRYFSSKSTMVKNDGDSVESIIVNSNKTSGECNAIWGYINGDWTIVAGSANTANLPAGIQSIGNSAFREIAITILTLPGSVNNIEKNAFHTSGIQTLNIGGEVVVGDDAFNHCYDLSAIYYFANKIDISAFTGSNNNFIESHGTNTTFT